VDHFKQDNACLLADLDALQNAVYKIMLVYWLI